MTAFTLEILLLGIVLLAYRLLRVSPFAIGIAALVLILTML